jgi:hypothetical protein
LFEPDEYVPLDRTFSALSLDADTGDDADVRRLRGTSESVGWKELITSTAPFSSPKREGGKISEIRQATLNLRQQGRPALF